VIDPTHFAVAALLNSIWEAPLIAFLLWLCLRATPKCTASTRYVAWFIALLAASILPLVTADVQIPRGVSHAASVHKTVAPAAVTSGHSVAESPIGHAVTPSAPAIERPRVTLPQNIVLAITYAWAALAALFLLRLCVELYQLERFKRDALPLPFQYRDALARWAETAGYGRDTRVCVSPHTDVPVAIGLFDAMILLPEQLLEQLSEVEIEHIALHELAHLRRHDDWFNALERVLVTLYFFNPAIRWIAAQLDVEREVACDDHVVEITHEIRPYAHCLTRMAEVTQWPRSALAAPGAFVTRKSMSIRIERLLRAGTSGRVRISYGTALAALITVGLVFTGAQVYGPVVAAPLNAAPPVKAVVALRKTAPPHKSATAKHAVPPPRLQTALAQTEKPEATQPPFVAAVRTPKPARAATPRPPRHIAAPPHAATGRVPRCEGCNLSGIDWRGRDLRGIVLHGANLSDADLRDADLRDADLSGSNLSDVRLNGARLQGARLTGVNLSGDVLRGVDLTGAHISGASIDATGVDEAMLRTLLATCTGCNFSDLDGRGKNLSGLRISGINLGDADLRDADLRNTVFNGINLAGIRLQGAKLDGATFNGCNFAGADLRGVDLSRASLTGSNLSDAILR